jgi:hypothetical protein
VTKVAAVEQTGQPGQAVPMDFDQSAVESLSVERNTKGYNWKIRVVRKEGESLTEAHQRLVHADRWMRQDFGN